MLLEQRGLQYGLDLLQSSAYIQSVRHGSANKNYDAGKAPECCNQNYWTENGCGFHGYWPSDLTCPIGLVLPYRAPHTSFSEYCWLARGLLQAGW